MTDFLQRFSLLDAGFRLVPCVVAGMLWLLVLACAISSIRTQPFTAARRRFWIAITLALPLLGLLLYLPFSHRRPDA